MPACDLTLSDLRIASTCMHTAPPVSTLPSALSSIVYARSPSRPWSRTERSRGGHSTTIRRKRCGNCAAVLQHRCSVAPADHRLIGILGAAAGAFFLTREEQWNKVTKMIRPDPWSSSDLGLLLMGYKTMAPPYAVQSDSPLFQGFQHYPVFLLPPLWQMKSNAPPPYNTAGPGKSACPILCTLYSLILVIGVECIQYYRD